MTAGIYTYNFLYETSNFTIEFILTKLLSEKNGSCASKYDLDNVCGPLTKDYLEG
jgi:hypothetical protein